MTEQREKAAAEPPLDCQVGHGTPRVEALIDRVMAQYKGISPASQAKYYEEVHQHLAPLARELERENVRLRKALDKYSEDEILRFDPCKRRKVPNA